MVSIDVKLLEDVCGEPTENGLNFIVDEKGCLVSCANSGEVGEIVAVGDTAEEREVASGAFCRWFEWGAFCPVMRLHGDREPRQPQVGTTGGAGCCSGADNEVWSYGEEVYGICIKYMELREKMRPYTRSIMEEAHKKGTPVMRTLFYMYPEDSVCWDVEDEYFYGPVLLVAPVLHAGQSFRNVYLPKGEVWVEHATGKEYEGGQEVRAEAPLDTIPVFMRKGTTFLD